MLPKGCDSKAYATRPWKITAYTHDGNRFDLGGRTLEVIATPGHTPDAISLLDRTNGLLFTGDTYYPAPIWLFRPETDLDAYAASIRRLAALAPQVKVVMGAHNIPVASPTLLPRLVAAFDAVRAGQHWTFAYRGALQAYNLSACAEFPASPRTVFSNAAVYHGFPDFYEFSYPNWIGVIPGYGGPTCHFAVVAASGTLDY